jgi:hypothetical protein
MKRLYAVIAALALSLTLGVTAMAQGKGAHKGAKKAGCSSCEKAGATPEQIRKFKADSIDLRQEMMNKRFDLQRENLKETPDSAKVAAIKADMEAIKVKIDALKTAAKLPTSASCCQEDCPLMDGNCDKCQSGKGCCCKECKDGKSFAKTGKHCRNCDKKSDCCCKDCSCTDCKGAGCEKCDKKAGCDKCNKGKAAKK